MRPATPLFLSLLPIAALCAQEKLTLRYAFQPGQVTWTQQTQQMTQSMSVRGRNTVTNMTTDVWVENKVTEVVDGVATIEARYARIVIKGDGMMKVDYDSDVEGSKPGVMRSVANLVGRTAKMRVDATGKIVEFTTPETREDQRERPGMGPQQAFELQFVDWPKDPVAVGETWQTSRDFPMGPMGTTKATITNKLVAWKDQVATVEQTMAMDASSLSLPGIAKVEITIPKAGCAIKAGLANPMPIDCTMDIEVEIGGKGAPMTAKQVQHVTTKQVPAPAPKKAAEPAKDEPKKDEKKGDGK